MERSFHITHLVFGVCSDRYLGRLLVKSSPKLAESRSRKSAQDDKWSFCLTAGTLWPANQGRPCGDDHAGGDV